MQLAQVQPQGVGHHAEAGQAHGCSTELGVQGQAKGDEHTGCKGDADGVVEEGPEQVFVNVAQSGAAQANGGGHVAQAAVHQYHVGGVNGNVSTGTDGNTNVGAGQGGRIVW